MLVAGIGCLSRAQSSAFCAAHSVGARLATTVTSANRRPSGMATPRRFSDLDVPRPALLSLPPRATHIGRIGACRRLKRASAVLARPRPAVIRANSRFVGGTALHVIDEGAQLRQDLPI